MRTQIEVNGISLSIGDNIIADGVYGRITLFPKLNGSQLIRVWRLEAGEDDPQELIATTQLTDIQIEKIEDSLEKVTISTKSQFSPGPNSFYCHRGIDKHGKYTEEFDWEAFSQLSSGGQILKALNNLVVDEVESGDLEEVSVSLFGSPRKSRRRQQLSYDEDSDEDEEFEMSAPPTPSKRKRASPKKRMKSEAPEPIEPARTPRKQVVARNEILWSDEEGEDIKETLIPVTPRRRQRTDVPVTPRSLPTTPHKSAPDTPHNRARSQLHVSSVPESLPCRESQFSRLFLAVESAISSGTGTCIFISGTPGTGKSATCREVVEQLNVRKEDGELPNFNYLEINGLKVMHPDNAYEVLFDAIKTPETKSSKTVRAMVSSIEHLLNTRDKNRVPTLVLLDELDQFINKTQSNVLYNFFNWPTLPNSKLIVLAVANTLDLPERFLSNKVISRLGITRIQFPGYKHNELKQILTSRLEDIGVVQDDAVEYVARKVGSVSGDARRALDLCRRAVELGDGKTITIDLIHRAIAETQQSTIVPVLGSLALGTKLFLLALLQYSKRTQTREFPVGAILEQCRDLVNNTKGLDQYSAPLYGSHARMIGYQHALAELVECGILSQQNIGGDVSANVRLMIDEGVAREAVLTPDLKGIL